jgi:hypothetical protein
MICTTSLYEECQELFANYPLAVKAINNSGTIRSMVLMLRDSNDVGFFVLSNDDGDGAPLYSLCPWPTGDITYIEADGGARVPDVFANVVTRGVPLPRHGSIFGWTEKDTVTALVVIYTEYEPDRPLPRWTVMPLAGTPEPQWPPFTGRRLFGYWFWEQYRTGRTVSLDRLIAETPDTVFWVNTQAILGSDCCAVAHDIGSPERYMLRQGCYVYSEALRAGELVPSLAALLADTGKTDLAPRFRRSAYSDGRPRERRRVEP